MNKIESPCEGCEDNDWCEKFTAGDKTKRIYIECLPYHTYQARIQQQAEDWEHIGEEFFEPVVNLYVKPEYKEFVSELWQRIKEGRC